MAEQNFHNHVRWYIPHHFVFYPLALLLAGIGIYFAVTLPDQRAIWLFVVALLLLLTWFSYMVRQHYAMTLQNRLVLLELRYRYYATTHLRFEPLEKHLSFGQRAALRFASDDELPALAQRAVDEKLSPTAIKKAIVAWKGDYRRV